MNLKEDKTSYEYKSRKLLTRIVDKSIIDIKAILRFRGKIKYKLTYKEPCWIISIERDSREMDLQICCLDRKTNLKSIYLDRIVDGDFEWDGLGNNYSDVKKFVEDSLMLLTRDK